MIHRLFKLARLGMHRFLLKFPLYQKCCITYRKHPALRAKFAEILPVAKTCFFWLIICELFLVIQVYPLKILIDGISNGKNGSYLFWTPVSLLLAYVFGSMVYSKMDNPRNSFDHGFKYLAWSEAHRVELGLSADFHVKYGTGEKEAIIAKNLIKLEQIFGTFIFDIIPVMARILSTSAVMFLMGYVFKIGYIPGFIALGTLVAFFAVLAIHNSAMWQMTLEYTEEQRELEKFGSALTQSWRIIKSLGIESEMSQLNAEKLKQHWMGEGPRHADWRRRSTHLEHVTSLSRAVLVGYFCYLFYKSPSLATAGTVSLMLSWMERVYSNYGRLSNFLRILAKGKKALEDLLEIFCLTPLVKQANNPKWPSDLKGKIVLSEVTFTYPDTTQPVLKDLNLTIEPRSMVALVGKTGSGKSTLALLLAREYDPSSGQITIDETPLQMLDYHRFRKTVGVVSQATQLFDASIRQNLLYSNPIATDQEIIDALQKAYAWEFIEKFSGDTPAQKLDTLIGENGIKLSGGQRQRLAIARALIRNPWLLILDEATSALDAESQILVTKAIDNLIENHNMTVVVIAHRFSTIAKANLVVVLDEGRVTETGTHQELLAKGGLYNKLKELEMGINTPNQHFSAGQD